MAVSESSDRKDPLEALKEHLPDFPSGDIHLVNTITSRLGRHNPFTHELDPASELLWLFDNTAYLPTSGTQQWQSELIAAYFSKRSGAEASHLVASLAELVGLAHDEEAKKMIARRLVPFLNQILPAHTAEVQVGHEPKPIKIGPSGSNGISRDVLTLPIGKDAEVIGIEAAASSESVAANTVPANTVYAAAEGFAVVSDVDDTLKITLTNAPLGILKTTFVDEPQPVKGMPEFLGQLHQKLNNPAMWYLSASPYNLYPFLREFRNKHFPKGTMILRNASWMNLAGFLASLSKGTQDYKFDHLKRLQSFWPQRKIVCIGDSTQADPESYGQMYRQAPNWIKAIWIRKVDDVVGFGDIFPGQGQDERNKKERFEKAFEGVPRHVWHVFEDPKELYEKVDDLIKSA